MAFPTILIDSATGSDTLASGAGPATALTGTTGVSAADGLSVDLSADAPDLSGVPTDGSAALYYADATAGNRNFAKITAANNVSKVVTIANAVGASLTKAWAIGGKRASIAGTNSLKLVENNGGNGDALAGWTVQFQSGHSETTIGAAINIRVTGDTTSGPFIFEGIAGAATMPLLTFTINSDCILIRNSRVKIRNIELRNSNATKSASRAIDALADRCVISGMKIAHSTDKFYVAIDYRANAVEIRDNNVGYCAGNCIESGTGMSFARLQIHGNFIHNGAARGIDLSGDATFVIITDNIIYSNGTDGIFLSSAAGDVGRFWEISRNTIDSNSGDGIEIANDLATPADIKNNLLSNNSGYGLKFSHASATAVYIDGQLTHVQNNNTYNNTSGGYLPTSYGSDDPGLNPVYRNASGGDFSIEPNLKGQGYPETNVGGVSGSTRSYVDIGAAQRNEFSIRARAAIGI